MKILFMGTPDIAAHSLEALCGTNHTICGAFTREDKPVGRKQVLTAPPVKQVALTHDIPVFQPKTLRDGTSEQIIRDLAPDLIVGQWDAVEMVQHTDQGTEVQVPEPGTYTLTVNADGTFTADFGGPTAGQWNYSEYDFNSGYNFSFLYEGHDGSMMYSTHIPGQLRAFYEIDGIQYGFTMRRP